MPSIKKSIEAYVYWFYNKYTFETYFGSRSCYDGSYKDDFLNEYNSSSHDEEFLRALENNELVGEVIAVFTGRTYKEVQYAAYLYEQILIYLYWQEVGAEHSYNRSCWYNGHFCKNPFCTDISKENNPRYIEVDVDEIKMLAEQGYTKDEIAEKLGVSWCVIHKRCKWNNIEVTHKDTSGENNCNYKYIDIDKLIELHEQGLTPPKIAKQFNTNAGFIRKRLKALGITPNELDRHTFYSEHNPMAGVSLNGSKNGRYIDIPYETLYKLRVIEKMNKSQIARYLNLEGRVVCRRLKEYGIA